MTKEKEILFNVLEVYKDMPYLWNKNHEHYMNRNVRNDGYQVLLGIYNNFDANATIKTLKKKIENMRTKYLIEWKKVKASKHTAASDEDVYVPTIWYYDSFSFLESAKESWRSVMDTMDDETKRNNANKTGRAGGKNEKFSPVDDKNLVTEIIGKDSPILEGIGVQDSMAVKNQHEDLYSSDSNTSEAPNKHRTQLSQETANFGISNKKPKKLFAKGSKAHKEHDEETSLRKRKLELQVEFFKLKNYKLKLEILEMEQHLNVTKSKFTSNIKRNKSQEDSDNNILLNEEDGTYNVYLPDYDSDV